MQLSCSNDNPHVLIITIASRASMELKPLPKKKEKHTSMLLITQALNCLFSP